MDVETLTSTPALRSLVAIATDACLAAVLGETYGVVSTNTCAS